VQSGRLRRTATTRFPVFAFNKFRRLDLFLLTTIHRCHEAKRLIENVADYSRRSLLSWSQVPASNNESRERITCCCPRCYVERSTAPMGELHFTASLRNLQGSPLCTPAAMPLSSHSRRTLNALTAAMIGTPCHVSTTRWEVLVLRNSLTRHTRHTGDGEAMLFGARGESSC
jgi:hypothetical protein